MRRCPPRLLGVVCVAASGVTAAIHRAVWETARHGPAQPVEFALALSTFVLASFGLLLVIHGGKLLDPPACRNAGRTRADRERLAALTAPISPRGRAFDTRHGVAAMQARRALVSAGAADRSARTRARTLPARTGTE